MFMTTMIVLAALGNTSSTTISSNSGSSRLQGDWLVFDVQVVMTMVGVQVGGVVMGMGVGLVHHHGGQPDARHVDQRL